MKEQKEKSIEKESVEKIEEKKEEISKEEVEGIKKEEKKIPQKKIVKDFAVANGTSLRISTKYSADICRIIKGKNPENAIKRLTEVLKKKRAIPMERRETPHQKGMSGGKFPINACKEIITLIKQANNNANVNGIENQIIFIAKANKASAPFRRGGRRAKRTHVYLEIRDKTKLEKKE